MNQEITEETRRFGESFRFFGPATFLFAVLYAFCMYRNGAGITCPFLAAGGLLLLRCSFAKLGISCKKGTVFYEVSILLLAVSTCCTDDARIIFFNKLGILLLVISLLLGQFYDTSRWDLSKYLLSVCQVVFCSLGEAARPVTDLHAYFKNNSSASARRLWYAVVGLVLAVPLFLLMLVLLTSADAVFRSMTSQLLADISIVSICQVLLMIAVVYFAVYMLLSFVCRRTLTEEVCDHRKGEPIIAITITGMLSALYLVFSIVQIWGLFLGKLTLPDGYTYAEYAREGFFQLLAVSLMNLVMVLYMLRFFRESRVLKGLLIVTSLCTYIMIASSAMRMILYIRSYRLTFLRLLVLWGLALLAVLFAGVLIRIVREGFPLFRYCTAAVTVLYLALSFSHPDYVIASVNIAAGEPDQYYLWQLSADAAPALVPYLREAGYTDEDFEIFAKAMEDADYSVMQEVSLKNDSGDSESLPGNLFGYYYVNQLQEKLTSLNLRTFNLSRYLARQLLSAG